MSHQPGEKTLADYLHILRRGKWIVALTALICGVGALGISLLVHPTYEAEASLAVQDPNASVGLTGIGAPATETPLQIALSHAAQVTRPEVLQRVAADVGGGISSDQLRRSADVSVDPNSALIDIVAHSGSATMSALIANAFARDDTMLTTAETRHQYAVQAKRLAKTLKTNSGASTNGGADLAQLAPLETASAVATPVQVNTTARVPTAPSSPRPLRNALAGLIFGLLLGVALAYGQNALDRRLRQASDVEELLPHPVVGAIREEALGRSCAHADLTSNGFVALAPHDEESFRVLRQNVRYLAAEPLRTVLVTSAVAEEGKSTIACCFAAAAAWGQRALLVECDLRRPVLASRLGLPERPGLTDYLTGNAAPDDVVHPIHAFSASANGSSRTGSAMHSDSDSPLMSCIAAGTRAPRAAELLASDRFRTFLSEVSEVYDAVILDGAPLLTVADALELVPLVSAVLLCVRLRQTTREQAQGVHAALERLPDRPIGVVLTAAQEEGLGYYGYYGLAEQTATASR